MRHLKFISAAASFTVLLLATTPVTAALAAEPVNDVRDGDGGPRRERAVDDRAPPASLFSTYHANYLVIGAEHSPVAGNTTSKFQLSLKYDTGANWYFAYTQRSYWDIARESSPIIDHNIEPEVFYYWKSKSGIAERWHIDSVRTGFVHQSNGKDGVNSRAWNRAYIEPQFRRRAFFFEPRVWVIVTKDEQNRDIADYYGYADIVFGIETAARQRFAVTGRQGLEHGSLQIDLSMPAKSLFTGNTMRPYLYAQLWTGYGETLLYYNVRTSALRIGIEFHP
jgi:outer membrane phospholipase A